jgi:hypothetical protein
MFTDTLPRLGVRFTDRSQPGTPARLGRLIDETLCALQATRCCLKSSRVVSASAV